MREGRGGDIEGSLIKLTLGPGGAGGSDFGLHATGRKHGKAYASQSVLVSAVCRPPRMPLSQNKHIILL